MLESRQLCHLLDWRRTCRCASLHQLAVQIAGQELQTHSVSNSQAEAELVGHLGWTFAKSCGHLLVVEVHVDVIIEGQRARPHHPSQTQADGAVAGEKVEHVLLGAEKTHPTL